MADPLAVAGVALSAVGVPAQLFSSCVLAFNTFSDVSDFADSINTLCFLLKVQRTRFLIWGQNFDIYGAGTNLERLSPIIQETLISTLIKIKELLHRVNDVAENYGLRSLSQTAPETQYSPSAYAEIQRQATMVFKVDKSCNMFKRLRWVIHDRQKFAILVTQLTSFVDALYGLCPVDRREELTHAVDAEVLVTTIIENGFSGVRALQAAARGSGGESLRASSNMALALEGARQAYAAATASLSMNRHQFCPTRGILVDFRNIKIVNSPMKRSDRSLAILSSQEQPGGLPAPILVEWRTYSDATFACMSKEQLQSRLEGIIRMLQPFQRPPRFRVLDCIGYFEDNEANRFGIVYRYPSTSDPAASLNPFSLYQMLIRKKNVPYLEERFALAAFLAESLFELLASNWVHKSISSHNVLFFQHEPEAWETCSSLREPYFSGFAQARPGDQTTASSRRTVALPDGVYRHPDVTGLNGIPHQGYAALHDIYSLGAVLLEIGTWVHLEIWHVENISGAAFRDKLLSKVVPQLGPAVGKRYMTAVRKCLEGRFDGLRGFDGRERDYNLNLQRCFYWEVVSELKLCLA